MTNKGTNKDKSNATATEQIVMSTSSIDSSAIDSAITKGEAKRDSTVLVVVRSTKSWRFPLAKSVKMLENRLPAPRQ